MPLVALLMIPLPLVGPVPWWVVAGPLLIVLVVVAVVCIAIAAFTRDPRPG
jgi:hypothetical protein